MVKRWFVVGVTFTALLLLVGCGASQQGGDTAGDATLEQLSSLLSQLNAARSQLNEAQSDLTEAQSQVEGLESELTEAQDQIESLDSDLTDALGHTSYLQNMLSTATTYNNQLKDQVSALESQLSDYDTLVEKIEKAQIYAELLEKYILVPAHLRLAASDIVEIDHIVHRTGNEEVIAKWATFFFSGDDDDEEEFLIAVGDGLWAVFQ